MLVGGALVSVHGQSLVDHLSVQIQFLAQGLHDELLEVFGEEFEAVFVGENHHVLGSPTFPEEVPHERELCGGIVSGNGVSGGLIAGLGPGQQSLDVQALQGGGQ